MAAATARYITLEEYSALPEGPPHYEYEEGELIPVTSPSAAHQDILSELNTLLRRHVRRERSGRILMEVDVYLPDGSVLIPDLTFVSVERQEILRTSDGKVHGAPDLVVEITSPNDTRDRGAKFQSYYRNGVPNLWLVDSRTLLIEEYHAGPDGYIRGALVPKGEVFAPAVFPGLSFNLDAILAGDDL